MNAIERNLELIRARIEKAAAASGRSSDDILLLPISKTFPVEAIARALAAGVRRFGENRVQEAQPKIDYFSGREEIEWHLVGHLQSNKATAAARMFDVIHSVDSLKLARRLDKAAAERSRPLSVFIQVDLGEEATKFGAARDRVGELVAEMSGLSALRLDGLMTLPPYLEDPLQTRPYFRELRLMSEAFERERPGCLGRRHLSMGMSHDFEVAVAEGATIVRIGTAIFGERDG